MLAPGSEPGLPFQATLPDGRHVVLDHHDEDGKAMGREVHDGKLGPLIELPDFVVATTAR